MCMYELEPCQVWREEPRKARKRHTCASCNIPIEPGTKYTSHFSVFDGEATTEALCLLCTKDRKKFADEHGQYMTPGSFPVMLNDCIWDSDPESKRWQVMQNRINARVAWAKALKTKEA